ncbi:hypothetical protein COT77_01985, partial [Candidatus Berkelbacteria bacterium CG10_big_fil_rev_8_21_14_0_10_41_12]
PTFSNLGQFKSDGVTAISEGGTTTESIVVFKAIVNDPDNDKAKLQVQIKEDDQEWQDIMESDFVDSGSEAIITKYGLIEAQYRWRARAADERGGMSEWQEFGTPENVDFEVKIVPLYTQVVSSYPSEEATRFWFNEYYARGDIKPYFCGSRIYQCGCAITSVVMIARYYDVVDANGKDVNPGEINEWLKNEPGGYLNGDANWIAAAKYTGYRIKYEKTDKITNNYALLDEKLNNNQPVIAKANAGRGGINRKHFFVIDDKSASTYTVKDPAWYNTKILNEGISDDAQHIRNYENGFDGLRIYKKGDGIAQSAIALALGSPAELLVTDSLGRKLGKDPITGIEYNEIPDAWYFEDGFDDPTGETPPSQERNKLIQILEPVDGEYNIQVIGTGTGSYTMNLSVYDETGESKDIAKEGETTTDNIQEFTLGYSAETVEEVEFHKIVDIDIKPGSDPNTINLKSKGVTPVAILTDEFFDAKDIVLNSIILAGASPTKGKLEDVDNDGDLDLILHFETQSLQLISGDTEATLTGELKDGTLIEGTDFIRIISTKK